MRGLVTWKCRRQVLLTASVSTLLLIFKRSFWSILVTLCELFTIQNTTQRSKVKVQATIICIWQYQNPIKAALSVRAQALLRN